MKIIITGGAGFIGSSVIREIIKESNFEVVNLDVLTYAGNLDSLLPISDSPRYIHEKINICDSKSLKKIFKKHQPNAVMHLAAESHVDNSINNPSEFVSTNINGTMVLLEAFRKYCTGRFLYVSTDEIYGALGPTGVFTETSPLAPNSPYSASKAAAGLMVRSYHKTFKLNVVTTSCSNNYGPHQHREKLIPTVITTALNGEPIPVYGNGKNVRDWLHVDDHCRAIDLVFRHGDAGETYNIGGDNEVSNIDLVKKICGVLNRLKPADAPYENQILFVEDRKGHDFRYAVDATKIKTELNWCPSDNFDILLEQTIKYYV